jgi:hypothetical protein
MKTAAAAAARKPKASPSARLLLDYYKDSQRPLSSLLFLLPLIILYELGTWLYASDPFHGTETRIIAFNLMRDFFQFFGATGKYLPALAVVGILLAWHIAHRDSWTVDLPILAGMAIESALLAVPIIFLSALPTHRLPLFASANWRSLLVLSVGAGIYEELVFRLIALTLLNLLLIDVLKVRKSAAALLIVLIPALLFSLYHYLGSDTFTWQNFTFRTLAGIYFGILFMFRGFGITAGTHAAYDLMIVAAVTWSS